MNQKNLTFEESMGRLEQIVRSLEQGNVPLEESLKLFQEGTQLVRSCSQLLDNAQLQIQKVQFLYLSLLQVYQILMLL